MIIQINQSQPFLRITGGEPFGIGTELIVAAFWKGHSFKGLGILDKERIQAAVVFKDIADPLPIGRNLFLLYHSPFVIVGRGQGRL